MLEHRAEYASEFEAIRSSAAKFVVGSPETLRKWIRRAEINSGVRPGPTTAEYGQIKAASTITRSCVPVVATSPDPLCPTQTI